VPYAAPPVGNLRWKPPQPRAAWSGVRACAEFGPSSWQPTAFPEVPEVPPPANMSEDCLYLNVWTPAVRRSDALPVMVWIHGGALIGGSGSEAVYDGVSLARRGVVLVTINYRLGLLGFLAHAGLSAESPQNVSGNYGLLDQRAAIAWVGRNIAAFGGDPNRITIFGESAGGASVTCHMVSPLSAGLFHRAISQSGVTLECPPLRGGSTSMEAQGQRAAERLGVAGAADVAAALRARTPQQILAAQPAFDLTGAGDSISPNVDGWFLPALPGHMFDAGLQHDVPFMAGTTADEGTMFAPLTGVWTVEQYEALAASIFGAWADEALAMYPANYWWQVQPALARVITDAGFVMRARFVARAHEQKASNAYLYHFTRVPPAIGWLGLGATHASEIPYVFGNMLPLSGPIDYAVSEAMGAAWVRFAATGNPNPAGTTEWPVYTAAADPHREFGDVIRTGADLHEAGCDFFEAWWRSQY